MLIRAKYYKVKPLMSYQQEIVGATFYWRALYSGLHANPAVDSELLVCV